MSNQYELYDVEVTSVQRRRHACRRHDLLWSYCHCEYLGRPWGACLAGVPIPDPETGATCEGGYLELCLFEQVESDGEPRQLNRWLAMKLLQTPAGTAQGLLDPGAWPWRVPADETNVLLSRADALAAPRLEEYWSLAAFLIEHEESLHAYLRATPEVASLEPHRDAAPAEPGTVANAAPGKADADADAAPSEPEEGFICAECGESHAGLATAYRMRFPDLWFEVPREEWRERVWLNGPLCTIDAHRFIRGVLRIPIEAHEEQIEVHAWVEVARHDYERAQSLWGTVEWGADSPYEGTLANAITGYEPTTLHLPCLLRPPLPGEAVLVQTAAIDHPLSLDQRLGAPAERLRAMAGK